MAQSSRVLAAFPGDFSLISGTHTVQFTAVITAAPGDLTLVAS